LPELRHRVGKYGEVVHWMPTSART
jgi:hypothetical protein